MGVVVVVAVAVVVVVVGMVDVVVEVGAIVDEVAPMFTPPPPISPVHAVARASRRTENRRDLTP
jgi:hypothetical protein